MTNKTKTTTRITLDLPVNLAIQVKTLANQNGETLKQFFIDLAVNKTKQNKTVKIRKRPEPIKLGISPEDLETQIDKVWTPKF